MKTRLIKWLTGCIAIVSVSTALAVPPVDYEFPPVHFQNVPFFDCSVVGFDFWILGSWTHNEYGREHFDNNGNLMKINGFWYFSDPASWNANDPSKGFFGDDFIGTLEHNHYTLNFDDDGGIVYREVGINLRFIIPGTGPISMNAGLVEYIWNGEFWELTKITPNRYREFDDKLYKVCLAHS